MLQLIALHYSPWSERARWSLDHHGIPYEFHDYVPMIGEPILRLKLGKISGKVSVPVLITEDGAVEDSWNIVQYAEKHGKGETLLGDRSDFIKAFTDSLQPGLAAARIRTTKRIMKNPTALTENLPEFIPPLLHGASIPLAWLGSRYLIGKYQTASEDGDALLSEMRHCMNKIRSALTGKTITGKFSYADMAAATFLEFVSPVEDKYIYLGPESRKCWTEPQLVEEYADLISWRDGIYRQYRR